MAKLFDFNCFVLEISGSELISVEFENESRYRDQFLALSINRKFNRGTHIHPPSNGLITQKKNCR